MSGFLREPMLSGFVDSVADQLHTVPPGVLIGAFCLPTLLALLTRDRWCFAATALINGVAVGGLLGWFAANVTMLVSLLALVAALIVALGGFRAHRQSQQITEIAARVDHLDRQVKVFLDALDRRAHIVDERADEMRKMLERLMARRGEAIPPTVSPSPPRPPTP
jgi:uncharacterized membrane protein